MKMFYSICQKIYPKIQISVLVILRVLIGWQFLNEGLLKLLNPAWSAERFLLESKGFMASTFISIANNSTTMEVVDFLNVWGLIAIGLGLILGLFSRFAAVSGAILLILYYLAQPPFIGFTYSMPLEGHYLIVNKTLIEASALLILAFFPCGQIGLDRLIFKKYR